MRQKIDTDLDLSHVPTKRKLLTAIGAMQGVYSVEIKPRRPHRSNNANSYYWAVPVKALQEFLADQGEYLTLEEVHDLCKSKFLRRSVINQATGEIVGETLGSTAGMDTTDFLEYVDNCRMWLQDTFGILTPDPDPLHGVGKSLVGAK